MMTDAIQFDNVHRHFHKHTVLRGLSFQVKPGEVFALLGRNGAGKTTALRILLGFLAPEHRARISYVGEDHRLYGSMRVRDAIAFEAGTRPGFRRSFVNAAIERCQLRLGQRVFSLSRGQRAQLALILAVGTEPEVLIFDDPALGLDVVMRRELLDAMIDLLADVGCAVLFSSHHLQDVERVADRVGILHHGQLIVDATLEDLKRRVERRTWFPAGDRDLPSIPSCIAKRPRRDGLDLTLLDADPATLTELQRNGARLSDRTTPSLEELFLDLTAESRGGIFSERHDASPTAETGS